LLTVTQKNGPTLFCPPIGHSQERGDYQESWQPAAISEKDLADAKIMADKVTKELSGAGIWGVEFFLTDKGVYFSELSPRPHDTGMVTLAGTQNLSQFELHSRAILGLPIPNISLEKAAASAVILANKIADSFKISGLANALNQNNTDVHLFGKPSIRPYRRMGVALVYDSIDSDMNDLRLKAKDVANAIVIE
jgi:phosphoribosylglycinamide formyltransferase 2